MRRAALEKSIVTGRKAIAPELAKKQNFRKRHPQDCGHAQCQMCHSDKYPKRTPTRQEVIRSLKTELL